MSKHDQRNPDFEFLMDDDGRDPFAYGEDEPPQAEDPGSFEDPGYLGPVFEETSEEAAEEDDPLDYEDDYAAEAQVQAPAATPEPAPVPGNRPAGSNLPLILGLALTFAGIALGAAGTLGVVPHHVLDKLVSLGLQPGLMFMTGIILSGIGLGMRRSTQNSIQEFASRLSQEIDYLRSEVQTVTEQSNSARAAALAQSVEGVQAMMAKQEAMLGNLTKATRMFNKPLMDLASNVHDLDRKQEEVRRNVLAIEKAQSESIKGGEKRFEGLVEQLHTHTVNGQKTVTEALDAEGKKILSQVEAVLEASKLFADETGKRFQSLEDGMLDVLSEHSNSTTEIFSSYKDKLDALDKLAGLEEKLAELIELAAKPAPTPPAVELPELSQIQASVRDVQSAIRDLANRPAPAPVSAAAPAASTPSSPPAARTSSPPPAAKTGNEADPIPSPISGTQPSQTGGKVLSAIEKLKQLRGG